MTERRRSVILAVSTAFIVFLCAGLFAGCWLFQRQTMSDGALHDAGLLAVEHLDGNAQPREPPSPPPAPPGMAEHVAAPYQGDLPMAADSLNLSCEQI